MTFVGWLQILIYAALITALAKPLGIFLYRVYEGELPLARVFGPLERLTYRIYGVDPRREQTWSEYALAMLAFSLVSLLVSYALLRLQDLLPANPQHLAAVSPDLAFDTAASFTTNTNWQSYGGESTM